MARQIVIGLGYKKGSGKNTFAKFLGTHIRCSCNHLKVQEVSFAHKVKDLAFQLYGWAGIQRPIYYETHYSDKEITLPQLGKSPRQIWIEIGNKMREIYQNTWIDYALNGVKGDIIIITDMGFLNEAKAILFKHGYLIKIQRSGIPTGSDPREVELDALQNGDWDDIISNNGSLDDLYASSLIIWNKINAKEKVC